MSAAAKRQETADIRWFVFNRAQNLCESCKSAPATDLEHAWGRVRERQSVFNTMALCRECHRDRTDNKPSKVACLYVYLRHVTVWGYEEEIAKANAAILFFSTKAQLRQKFGFSKEQP